MADRLRRADRALRALAQGTASATGDEFFRSLARCAAQALGARYAVVAEGLSDTESRSLAFWEGSGFGPGFSFFLQGTPCSSVAAGRVCATASGLVAEYPEALWLQQIGAESYVGVPMRNGLGRAIGHLAVLHTEPMETTEEDIATLKIFAARGSAELERKQSDERLQKAHAELGRAHAQTQALLEIMWAVGHHLQREVLFGALAECLGAVVPTETFGIVLPTDGDQLQAYILNRRDVKSLVAPPLVVGAEGSASDWVLTERDWYVAGSREEVARRFPKTSCLMKQERMESLCILPLVTGDRVRGALFFMTSAQAAYATLERSFLGQVAGAVAVALDDCLLQEEMRRLNDELAAQKIARIEAQNSYLQEEIRSEHNFVEIIGNSPALLQVLRQIDQVAPTDSTVLICG
jgi:transcriptional regulator with GAF, ATPase, and Fis domain